MNVIKYVGTIKDNTHIIQMNKLLNNSLEQNKLILSNLHIGIGLVSTSFQIIWDNFRTLPANHLLSRYKTGDICYHDVYHRHTPCENCPIAKSMQTQSSVRCKRNWQGHLYNLTSTPVFKSNGEILGCVVKAEDISTDEFINEIVRLPNENNQIQSEPCETFFRNLNKDICKPINSIIQSCDLLTQANDPQSKLSLIECIKASKTDLTDKLKDIQHLSKLKAMTNKLSIKVYDFDRLFKKVIELHNKKGNVSIGILNANTYASCSVAGDESIMTQFLHLLITQIPLYSESKSMALGYKCTNDSISIFAEYKPNEKTRTKLNTNSQKIETASATKMAICQSMLSLLNGTFTCSIDNANIVTVSIVLPCEVKFQKNFQD